MSTWTERLTGWFEWLFWLFRRANFVITIQEILLRAVVTQERLDEIWNSLPSQYKNDPTLQGIYKEMKSQLKKDNVAIAEAQKAVNDLATPIIDQIINPLLNIEKCEPDTALTIAKNIIKAQLALDVTIGVAQFVSETLSLGQLETLTDFYKNFVRKTGVMGPVTMLMRSPVEMGVIRPLSYKLHETFRNVIPTPQWAAQEFMKGNLSSEYFDKVITWSGLYNWYEDALKKGMWREPRFSEIYYAQTDKSADEGWISEKLKGLTYDEKDRTVLRSALTARYLGKYWDKVSARYAYAFKEGFKTETDLRARLDGLGYPKSVVEFIVEDAKEWYEIDYKLDLLSSYDTGFTKDLITENDYRKLLAEIPLVPERLEERVYRMTMKKTPKPKAVVVTHRQGVKVSSTPSNAYIYFDGEDTILITPETLDTTVGTHTLDLYLPGYAVWSTEFSVAADQFIEVHAELEKIEEVI